MCVHEKIVKFSDTFSLEIKICARMPRCETPKKLEIQPYLEKLKSYAKSEGTIVFPVVELVYVNG